MSIETKAAGRLNGKYLTFNLQAESYGIDVLKVREIIRLTTITVVPQMPAYIRGRHQSARQNHSRHGFAGAL